MVFFSLCSSVLMAGCQPADEAIPQVALRAAAFVPGSPPRLRARLRIEPGGLLIEALERGLPLTLEVTLRPEGLGARPLAQRRLRLERSPLLERYRLREEPGGINRAFAHRNALLAAVEDLELILPEPPRGALRLELRLLREELPPPLQWPALLDGRWRLAGGFRIPVGREP